MFDVFLFCFFVVQGKSCRELWFGEHALAWESMFCLVGLKCSAHAHLRPTAFLGLVLLVSITSEWNLKGSVGLIAA